MYENKLFANKVFRKMKKFSIIYLSEAFGFDVRAGVMERKVIGWLFGKEQDYIFPIRGDGQFCWQFLCS